MASWPRWTHIMTGDCRAQLPSPGGASFWFLWPRTGGLVKPLTHTVTDILLGVVVVWPLFQIPVTNLYTYT